LVSPGTRHQGHHARHLPPAFQTAEFLVEHGLIDATVPRKEIRKARPLPRLLRRGKKAGG